MKKIKSKHHARTKSDNAFINLSKISNFEEENNTTSRDIPKLVPSLKFDKDKQHKKKFATNQKEDLYKIEENPKERESQRIEKQKSRSLNTIAVKKINNFLKNSENNEKSANETQGNYNTHNQQNHSQQESKLKEEKTNSNQIKITIKYYKKKVAQNNNNTNSNLTSKKTERSGITNSIYSAKNIFSYAEGPATHRNSNPNNAFHKAAIKTSNIILSSENKKNIDLKQLKQSYFNSSPIKQDGLLKTQAVVSNVEVNKVKDGKGGNVAKIVQNEFKVGSNLLNGMVSQPSEGNFKPSVGLLGSLNGAASSQASANAPLKVTDLSVKSKPEVNSNSGKIGNLVQTTFSKINNINLSSSTNQTVNSNKATFQIKNINPAKDMTSGKHSNLTNKNENLNEKLGYSFVKVAKSDFSSSSNLGETARDTHVRKGSINIIDVKKQLKHENEGMKHRKINSSKTNSTERTERTKSNNKIKFENVNNQILSKSIVNSSLVYPSQNKKEIDQKENKISSEKVFEFSVKNEMIESFRNNNIKKSTLSELVERALPQATFSFKNFENGGNYKLSSSNLNGKEKNLRMESILEDIYKESFSKNGLSNVNINANYVPKKFLKDVTNEFKDDSFEQRKTRIKSILPHFDEEDVNENEIKENVLQENDNENIINDEDESYDKTLIIDELNTKITPNDVLHIQNSSRDMILKDEKGQNINLNDFSSCDVEFSREIDENCVISGEEKFEAITKLPLFKSKQLSFYNSNSKREKHCLEQHNKKGVSLFLKHTSLKTILKFNHQVKENIFSLLSFNDLISFSMSSKIIRKETNYKLFDLLINLIINQNNAVIRLKIWKSLFRFSEIKYHNVHKLYASLSAKSSSFEEEIKKDLLRTLPEDPTFKKEKLIIRNFIISSKLTRFSTPILAMPRD